MYGWKYKNTWGKETGDLFCKEASKQFTLFFSLALSSLSCVIFFSCCIFSFIFWTDFGFVGFRPVFNFIPWAIFRSLVYSETMVLKKALYCLKPAIGQSVGLGKEISLKILQWELTDPIVCPFPLRIKFDDLSLIASFIFWLIHDGSWFPVAQNTAAFSSSFRGQFFSKAALRTLSLPAWGGERTIEWSWSLLYMPFLPIFVVALARPIAYFLFGFTSSFTGLSSFSAFSILILVSLRGRPANKKVLHEW